MSNILPKPGVILGGGVGGAPPVRGLPPNEIFGECKWTHGIKFSDYMLVVCQKLHI